ncbi:MAG: MarR family transcriptional regulator [Ilumatobacter sp.]
MSHASTPDFQTFHSLRIKGFANVDTLVEMTALSEGDVEAALAALSEAGLAQFRENRGLWQLTADGRTAHGERLATDVDGIDVAAALGDHYEAFLTSNGEFKELCSAWQLRGDEPNDHTDATYDGEVIARLEQLHQQAHPVVAAMGAEIARMSPYADRLEAVLTKVQAGESKMFTGVMCGSYHDVWMELHEDLILTQGIDRAAEGSF